MPIKPTALPIHSYQETFDSAISELTDLMAQREEVDSTRETLDERIMKLRDAVVGLGGLCNETADSIAVKHPELFPDRITPDVGFTDAIRTVFRQYPSHWLSPVWIRDTLEETGFDVKKYKNVLASIHSIVKRLRLKMEIMETNREGRTVYKVNPKGPLANEDDVPF